MRQQQVPKWVWPFLITVLLMSLFIIVLWLLPYENKEKTWVEPLVFSGSYRLSEKTPPLFWSADSMVDAGEQDMLILEGYFDRPIEKNSQVFFFSEYLEIHIFREGELLFSWGTEERYPSFLRSAGSAWGHMTVTDGLSVSDKVTIFLENKYKNNHRTAYRDFMDSLQMGDSGALARVVLGKNWIYIVTGLFLLLIGLLLFLFTWTLELANVKIHPSMYYCAGFILTASYWELLNPEYSTLLFGNSLIIMLMETLCMWGFSVFLCAYFSTFMVTMAAYACRLLGVVYFTVTVVFLLLLMGGKADAYAVRNVQILLFGIGMILFLFILGYELCHDPGRGSCFRAVPGFIYLLFGGLEVVNYEGEWFQRGMVLTIGFLLFVVTEFILLVGQIRSGLVMAQRAVVLEHELRESRTAIIISQIQPHFLYNSLLGIKQLCDTQPKLASSALEHFAYFLRGNLHAISETRLIPFQKELEHVKDYIYLEKMRFDERISVRWEIDFVDFQLPPLTLQPLAENAVRHGILKLEDGGELVIKSGRKQQQIYIVIADTGIGFDQSGALDPSRPHIGLANVKKRIQMQCGGSLHIVSEVGKGTQVTILLPERMVDDESDCGG